MALGRKTGGGSRKGIPNKTTRDVRSVYSAFVERNAERAQALFDQVAEKDPAKALDLLARISEFVVAKLSRSTIDAEPTPFVVHWPLPPHPLTLLLEGRTIEGEASSTLPALSSPDSTVEPNA
jgi:hypothetical protein